MGHCPISQITRPAILCLDFFIFFKCRFVCCIRAATLLQLCHRGTASAPVTASQSRHRILIGQKWPMCDPARGQTIATWRMWGHRKARSWCILGKMCPLFPRRRRAVVKAKKCRTAGKHRSDHSAKLDTDLNKPIRHSRFKDICCPHGTPVSFVFNSCIETSLNTQCSHIAH